MTAGPALPEHASVHDCLNEPLIDLDGLESGEICDLMINRSSGRVDFVRVAVDERRSARAQRYIAVPWSVIEPPSRERPGWRVRVRRETLRRMARFDVGERS